MRRVGWSRSLAVVCVAWTAAPSIVAAAPAEAPVADAKAEAKRLFEEGSEAYNLGNFEVAIERFEAAYGLTRANALLYNIAQAYTKRYELDPDPLHLRKAKVLFENFAKISESSGEDPRDARARAAAIGETLAGLAAEPTAEAPPGPTSPGPEATPPGPEPAPPAPTKKLPYRPGALGVAGYAAIGAGVLAGAALLTVGLVSSSRLEWQLFDESMYVDLTPERAALYGESFIKADALAFGGLGAGLGLAVVGAALVATDAVRGRRAARRASLGAGGLAVAF